VAETLRAESTALRLAARATKNTAHRRSFRAATLADASRDLRSSLLAPSPWSGLLWHRHDDALRTTLVPLREL
jgi:hypothetical protein